MTRLAETQVGEQVRATFDATAGASAIRTSAPSDVTYPFGAESGQRIVISGSTGTIQFFNADDELVGFLDPTQWAIGELEAPGHRLTIDPVGGIRFRSETDVLMSQMDQSGIALRDEQTGLVVAQLTGGDNGSFRLVDPTGTDDIEMVTSSLGTLPNPKYVSAVENNPSSSIVVPASAVFTSTPADDYGLYHAAAFLGTSQAATWIPPAGTTERLDLAHNTGTATLAVSIADRDPATGATGTFTSSQTNWTHGLGTHVVVRGGGTTSPSFRSMSEQSYTPSTATKLVVNLPKPTGTTTGDALIAFVSLGNQGGSVPTGWTTPEGWQFLGANFGIVGADCLAVGAWSKLATASEPATYDVTITIGAGSKRLHAAVVAVQNPFLISGGAHIRMAGHPIKRLLAFTEITTANAVLCDFQNIPGGYDHLELVYEAYSDRNTAGVANFRLQFNGDGTMGNYRWQVNRDNTLSGHTVGVSTDRIVVGACDFGALNAESAGSVHVIGYARPHRRIIMGNEFHILAGGDLIEETSRSMWLNSTDSINRVRMAIDAGAVLFNVGSRAYLYGY